ncbi:MAG TPA: family 20 glycosylhydrolase [Chthoniobacteraceae bacterium]|jgi:hexosaminidase|nr:family 20 glycosylhydrolase [Chthoniobacteraceae bacterium]
MKALGIKTEDGVQSWLFEQMAQFVAKRGRRAVGWQEIVNGGIPKDAVVMPWTGIGAGVKAANAGNDIIVATTVPNYFDSYQTDSPLEPAAYYHGITIGAVYNQTFEIDGIKKGNEKHILGAQAQLWGELMPKTTDVEYQAFPRSAALAEALWTPLAEKDFSDFSHRLNLMAKLWNLYSPPVNFHYLTPAPFAHWTPDTVRNGLDVAINDPDDLKALSSGSCGVVFDYTKGGQGLNIRKVELVSGGRVIAVDQHDGFTGTEKRRNIYMLHFTPGAYAAASLRVTADAGGSADSYGDITLLTGRVLDQHDPGNYPLGAVALSYWQPSDLSATAKARHLKPGRPGHRRRTLPGGTAGQRREQ